jgi:hypothetical protein
MQDKRNQSYQPPAGGIPVEQFQQPKPTAKPAPPQSAKAAAGIAVQEQVETKPQTVEQSPQPAGPTDKQHKKHQARTELRQAIGHSNEILITAQTVFPFTLFPDTITIDRSNLTVSHRFFFKTAQVTSIRIEDILNTTANIGPLFGSLKIATRFYGTDKIYQVNYLRRTDALRIKQILQGYIIALQKEIDCTSLPTKELARLLSELGAEAPDAK